VLLELFLHADERILDEGDSTAPVELDAGLEVGAEKPRPYGAVVVGLLPLPLCAVALRLVAVTLRAQGAEALRRAQLTGDDLEDGATGGLR
jgi:hypothetical protein